MLVENRRLSIDVRASSCVFVEASDPRGGGVGMSDIILQVPYLEEDRLGGLRENKLEMEDR